MLRENSELLNILDLPNELLLYVFDHLDFRTRLIASQVCRLWNHLTFTGLFMDRIYLSLNVTTHNQPELFYTLGQNLRCYRHISLQFDNCEIDLSLLVPLLESNDRLESLLLTGVERMEPQEMNLLLSSVRNLKKLIILNWKAGKETWTFPCVRTNNGSVHVDQNLANDWFSEDTPVVLSNLECLCLITSSKTQAFERLKSKFPNVRLLQITVRNERACELLHSYSNQLTNLAIESPFPEMFLTMGDLSFPKLFHLTLDRMELHDQRILTKCVSFFRNPNHCRSFRELIFHPKFMVRTPMFSTICDHCSNLRSLSLSLDYMDGDALKDITNLRLLENLTLQGTCYFRESPSWPIQIPTLRQVKIAGSRFPISLLEFIADIAPMLESLALEDVENPEEMFRTIPRLVSGIVHLEMGYTEGFERPPSCHPSGLLRTMNQLERYCLRRVIIKHGIQGWLQDASHLKSVRLEDCKTLTDTNLVILTTNCPKLRQLEIEKCSHITASGVQGFRERIPCCKVICDV
ncbi:uncharacterized protein LOC129754985 isoform X2 [Uranotaenia lowii]|nr:uncharacterized protein LOC129754985 isoform X2 [Uranotaenia lowii]